ncbi:MAG: hypothetical protein ACTTI3_04135 [Treponema sp.]
MKIDELKAKVDEAGLNDGRIPDGGEIVPLCFWSCHSGCNSVCSSGCTSSQCSNGCTWGCAVFGTTI